MSLFFLNVVTWLIPMTSHLFLVRSENNKFTPCCNVHSKATLSNCTKKTNLNIRFFLSLFEHLVNRFGSCLLLKSSGTVTLLCFPHFPEVLISKSPVTRTIKRGFKLPGLFPWTRSFIPETENPKTEGEDMKGDVGRPCRLHGHV